MTRWPQGAAEVEQQLAAGHLQQVTGGQANGAFLLEKAHRTIQTAALIVETDPDSASAGCAAAATKLEYPNIPNEEASQTEAQRAIDDARNLINAAEQILPGLSLF
ncbi:hypothetical protein BH24ACT14_BH24ACT14_06450 [soil metagenome]